MRRNSREGQGLGVSLTEPLGLVEATQLLGRLVDALGVLNVLSCEHNEVNNLFWAVLPPTRTYELRDLACDDISDVLDVDADGQQGVVERLALSLSLELFIGDLNGLVIGVESSVLGKVVVGKVRVTQTEAEFCSTMERFSRSP